MSNACTCTEGVCNGAIEGGSKFQKDPAKLSDIFGFASGLYKKLGAVTNLGILRSAGYTKYPHEVNWDAVKAANEAERGIERRKWKYWASVRRVH